LARGLDIIDADTKVSKALTWLRIAVGDLKVWVVFAPVVVCEFDYTLTVRPVVSGGGALGGVVGEEVEIEFVFRELEFADLFHSKELVEFDLGGC